MKNIILYHGSDHIIEKPIYHFAGSNVYNDYGFGFYCAADVNVAKEWANRTTLNGFANKYLLDLRNLKILDLTDKNHYSVLNWIAILLHHRDIAPDIKIDYADVFNYLENYYIDVTKYDVVIGFRADDAYFRFPLMFVMNVLTLDKLEEIYQLGNLGKQYVLISEKAFSHLKFIKSLECEAVYHDRYIRRKESADNSYRELERSERNSKGKRVRDLIIEDHD